MNNDNTILMIFFVQPNQWSPMEQHAFKNCLNTNIHSYLEISGGQRSNLYLNVVHFLNTSAN